MTKAFIKKPYWQQLGSNLILPDETCPGQIAICKHFLLIFKLIEQEYPNHNLIWDPLLLMCQQTGWVNPQKQIDIMPYLVIKINPVAKDIRWQTIARIHNELVIFGKTNDVIIQYDLINGETFEGKETICPAYPYDLHCLLPSRAIKIDQDNLVAAQKHPRR